MVRLHLIDLFITEAIISLMSTQACPKLHRKHPLSGEKNPPPPSTAADEAGADRSSDSKPRKIKYLRVNIVTSCTL